MTIFPEKLWEPNVTPSRYCIKFPSGSLFKCSKQIDIKKVFLKIVQHSNNSSFRASVYTFSVLHKGCLNQGYDKDKILESLKTVFSISTVGVKWPT